MRFRIDDVNSGFLLVGQLICTKDFGLELCYQTCCLNCISADSLGRWMCLFVRSGGLDGGLLVLKNEWCLRLDWLLVGN